MTEATTTLTRADFQHPIVGDGIKWKEPKKKTLGYKVLEGSKTTSLQVKKRDARGK